VLFDHNNGIQARPLIARLASAEILDPRAASSLAAAAICVDGLMCVGIVVSPWFMALRSVAKAPRSRTTPRSPFGATIHGSAAKHRPGIRCSAFFGAAAKSIDVWI
jgi:hypothetical protein